MKVAHEAGQPTRQPMPLIKRLRTVASAGAPPKRGALAVTAEMVSADDQTTVIKPVNVQTQEDERTLRVFDLLAAFLALNPTPSDQQIHALAGLAGLNPEYFESVIYRLVGVIQKEEEKTAGEDGLRNKIQELLNEDPMDTPAQPPQPKMDPVDTLDDDPEDEESQVSDEDVEILDNPDEEPDEEPDKDPEAVDAEDGSDDEDSDGTLEDTDEVDEVDEVDEAETADEELADDPEETPKPPPKKTPTKDVPPGKDGKVQSSIQRRIEASDPYGRAAEHDGVVDEELMGHPDPMKDASENDGALDEELE